MGSPKDVRVWSARERKAHYQEQADKLRAMAEAQPAGTLRAQPSMFCDRTTSKWIGYQGHPLSVRAPSHDCVIDDQHNDRADYSDKHAVNIETGHAGRAHRSENKASDNCSDYAKDDVQKKPLTGSVDDFTGDKSGDEAQDDPTN
jgi:hypothetical protein